MEENKEYEIVEENINIKQNIKFENLWITFLGSFLFIAILFIAFMPQTEKRSDDNMMLQYKIVSRFTELLTPKIIKFEPGDDLENLSFTPKHEVLELLDNNSRNQFANQVLAMWDEILKDKQNENIKREIYINMAVVHWVINDNDKSKILLESAEKQITKENKISNTLVNKISQILFNNKITDYQILSEKNKESQIVDNKTIYFTQQDIIALNKLPVSAIIMQKLDSQISKEPTFNSTLQKTLSFITTVNFLVFGGFIILTIFLTSGILWFLLVIGKVNIIKETPVNELSVVEETNIEEYPHSPHLLGIGSSFLLILTYLILLNLSGYIFNKYGNLLTDDSARLNSIITLYSMIFSATAVVISLWYITKSHTLIPSLFAPVKRALTQAFAGYTMVIPVVLFMSLIQLMLNHGKSDTQQVVQMVMDNSSDSVSRLLFAISIVVLAPIFEETLFRGFLFNALMRRMNWQTAALISAIAFGLIHAQLSTILPITALGYMLAILTYRNKSIIPAICAHAIFNSVQLISINGMLDILK